MTSKNSFKDVAAKTDFPSLEEEVLSLWKKENSFKKSIENREDSPEYVFYDGPPFATGLPHYGHLLAGTIKDIVPRYWTMNGYKVNRNFGWDCHGLPVEYEAAKDLKKSEGLDLAGQYEIENYGVGKFNEYCRSIVLKYTSDWERVVGRMGRWVDFENNYRTMDKDFMESVWWVFKELWKKDLVYEGYRVMPYSWKLSTPLSNFEAGENYQTVQDPAVTLKFKIKTDSGEELYALAWTTTPWTLPSNMALAVGKDIEYVKLQNTKTQEIYLLAKARVSAYKALQKDDYTELQTLKGAELTGLSYEPLFTYFADKESEGAFKIVTAEYVSTEDGTGIVHIAPAFGEDDFQVGKENKIPLVDPVDAQGSFTEAAGEFAGRNVKEADKDIIKKLKVENKIFDHATYTHNYPFCWRSNTPLIYKAISTWFVKVEHLQKRMMEVNEQIHWVPENIGKNRFGNWLSQARDWNIGRNRYWGTPIPVWTSDDGDFICIGSVAELEELSGKKIDDLHSHFIDDIEIKKDGKTYRRIKEVFDCWFESGAMPYAQNHYPFENKEFVESHFPADFIAEGLDQTRGWFYTLTVLSTILFDKPAFKNVVVNGLILAEDGTKMSKSKRNYPDPTELINKYGADILRSYMINSPVVRAQPLKFSEDGLILIYRGLISPLWNAYSFFITYANVDSYVPGSDLTSSKQELDVWILSHFQSLVKEIRQNMEFNLLYKVVPSLREFTELLTNWYIRRSRRRFWRPGKSEDKVNAFNTLYYILSEFAKVMAPFTPFLSEAMYQNLVCHAGRQNKGSVHIEDYPKVQENLINKKIEEEMDLAKKVVEMGRTIRAKEEIKIRQPLPDITLIVSNKAKENLEKLSSIIEEELNVKKIKFAASDAALVNTSIKPNFKVLGKKIGPRMKEIASLLKDLSAETISLFQEKGKLELAGITLESEDLFVDKKQKEGMLVLSEDGITLALNTSLNEELIQEGMARELVNRIQNQRKEAGFLVDDRIAVWVSHSDFEKCLETNTEYIGAEVLANSINNLELKNEEWDLVKDWDIDGKAVEIKVKKIPKS